MRSKVLLLQEFYTNLLPPENIYIDRDSRNWESFYILGPEIIIEVRVLLHLIHNYVCGRFIFEENRRGWW